MHIMATNLSVWIASVAKEATEALAFENLRKTLGFNHTAEVDDERSFSMNQITGEKLFKIRC